MAPAIIEVGFVKCHLQKPRFNILCHLGGSFGNNNNNNLPDNSFGGNNDFDDPDINCDPLGTCYDGKSFLRSF